MMCSFLYCDSCCLNIHINFCYANILYEFYSKYFYPNIINYMQIYKQINVCIPLPRFR